MGRLIFYFIEGANFAMSALLLWAFLSILWRAFRDMILRD